MTTASNFDSERFDSQLQTALQEDFGITREHLELAREAQSFCHANIGPCVINSLEPANHRIPCSLDSVLWYSPILQHYVLAEAIAKASVRGTHIPGTLTDDQKVDLSLFVDIDWSLCNELHCIPLRVIGKLAFVARPPWADATVNLTSAVRQLGPKFAAITHAHEYVVPTIDFVSHLRQVRRFWALAQFPTPGSILFPIPPGTSDSSASGGVHAAALLLDSEQMVEGSNGLVKRLLGLVRYAIRAEDKGVSGKLIAGLHRVALHVMPPSLPLVLMNHSLSQRLNNSTLGPDWMPTDELLGELSNYVEMIRTDLTQQVTAQSDMLESLTGKFDRAIVVVYGNSSSCWDALSRIGSGKAEISVVHVLNTDPHIALLQAEGAFRARCSNALRTKQVSCSTLDWNRAKEELPIMVSDAARHGRVGTILLLGATTCRPDGAFCEKGAQNVIQEFRAGSFPNPSVWLMAGKYKDLRRLTDEIRELTGQFHEFAEWKEFNGVISA